MAPGKNNAAMDQYIEPSSKAINDGVRIWLLRDWSETGPSDSRCDGPPAASRQARARYTKKQKPSCPAHSAIKRAGATEAIPGRAAASAPEPGPSSKYQAIASARTRMGTKTPGCRRSPRAEYGGKATSKDESARRPEGQSAASINAGPESAYQLNGHGRKIVASDSPDSGGPPAREEEHPGSTTRQGSDQRDSTMPSPISRVIGHDVSQNPGLMRSPFSIRRRQGEQCQTRAIPTGNS